MNIIISVSRTWQTFTHSTLNTQEILSALQPLSGNIGKDGSCFPSMYLLQLCISGFVNVLQSTLTSTVIYQSPSNM